MEVNRRAGQGRVAEIAGADLVGVNPSHPHARPLRAGAEQLRRTVAVGAKAAAGLCRRRHRFLDSHRNALPPEFLILGDKPEPWTPANSLVWGKLMSLQLSGNYTMESLRARLAQKLPADRAAWLFPAPNPDWPVTTAPAPHPDHASLDDARDRLGALLQMSHGASNERVVAGPRSDTASRSSPTIRTFSSARRSCGTWRASSRLRSRSRAAPFPACRCSARPKRPHRLATTPPTPTPRTCSSRPSIPTIRRNI